MTHTEYMKLEGINFSTANKILKAPIFYLEGLNHPEEDADHFRLGRCTHLAVLEPERLLSSVVLWPAKNGKRTGKKWAKFCDDNSDREILTEKEYAQCLALQKAVRSNPEAMKLLANGVAETPIQWTDEFTGLKCKARPDYASANLIDLKTTRDASPVGFGKESWRYRYHSQMAFYQQGLAAKDGIIRPVYLIAVEKEAPFVVSVFHMDEELLEFGRTECAEMLAKLSYCKANNVWPGYAENGEVMELMPPRWMQDMEKDEDNDLGELGLEE